MDTLVELALGFTPIPVLDSPILIQGDFFCALAFSARTSDADPDRVPARMAVIEFTRCLATRFGYPNDEALAGHPLYPAGLSWYGTYEVVDSSWLAQVNDQNRVNFPQHKGYTARHFVATFKESVFECLATDWITSLIYEDRARVVGRLAAQAAR